MAVGITFTGSLALQLGISFTLRFPSFPLCPFKLNCFYSGQVGIVVVPGECRFSHYVLLSFKSFHISWTIRSFLTLHTYYNISINFCQYLLLKFFNLFFIQPLSSQSSSSRSVLARLQKDKEKMWLLHHIFILLINKSVVL